MALNPKGWLNASNVGTTPIRPSGAVSMTMLIVDKDRTCRMMTISMAAIMAGNILPSAVLALAASSIDPPISMR